MNLSKLFLLLFFVPSFLCAAEAIEEELVQTAPSLKSLALTAIIKKLTQSTPEQLNKLEQSLKDNHSVYQLIITEMLSQVQSKPIKIFHHDNPVSFVAFDRTGNLLATGSDDDNARIFDIRKNDNQPTRIFDHVRPVNSVAFDSTGNLLAIGSYDDKARVFDLTTDNNQPTRTFNHVRPVNSVAFDPTGNLLATGCNDDKVRVFANGYGQLHIERGKEIDADFVQVVALYNAQNKQ